MSGKNYNMIIKNYQMQKYIEYHKIEFQHGSFSKDFQEIWFELFDEKISIKQSSNRIQYLRKHGFIFNFTEDRYTILKKYLIENKILFQRGYIGKRFCKVWFKLFNEKLSLEQSSDKIQHLKKQGFIFHFKDNSYSIFKKYIIEKKILFEYTYFSKKFQEIWFELFNENLSLTQSHAKINYLRRQGFTFEFESNKYSILKKHIIKNNIQFEYSSIGKKMQEIWFELFNEKLSLTQSHYKTSHLKKQGFVFYFKIDPYLILSEHLNNNSILFQKGSMNKDFQIIWLKLFNEELSLSQSRTRIEHLKKQGYIFHFKDDKYTILKNYLIKNKIVFQNRNIGKKIREVWFELFNEELSLSQSHSKTNYLRTQGFIFQFKDDPNIILKEYLIKNKIQFKKGETCKKIKKVWLKLFNQELSFLQSNSKINHLKKQGFIFYFKDNPNIILKEYLIKNKIRFKHRSIGKRIQEIWFKLFNEKLSLKQSHSRIQHLKKEGFIFHLEDNPYTILKKYLIENNILFEDYKTREKFQEIWFELFNEKLSLEQSYNRIYKLRRQGFKLHIKKNNFTTLIKHLENSNLWIDESDDGYKTLQIIWNTIFEEKINLEKSKSIFMKISSLSPQSVNRKILPGFVHYKNLNNITKDEYEEYASTFAIFCRKNKIRLLESIEEEKLSRIWSVCFAANK